MVKVTVEGGRPEDIVETMGGTMEKKRISDELTPVVDAFEQIYNALKAAKERHPEGKSRKTIAKFAGNRALEIYEKDPKRFGLMLWVLETFGIAKKSGGRWCIASEE